jgi:hypothetical protein
MAFAKKVSVEQFNVELTLSLEEAQVIFDITEKVGGNPHTSRRGLVNGVRRALHPIVGDSRSTGDICITDTSLNFK